MIYREPARFKVGDLVEHRASGERAVVCHVHTECENPIHGKLSDYYVEDCPDRVSCEPVEIDSYNLVSGFGTKVERVSGKYIRKVEEGE